MKTTLVASAMLFGLFSIAHAACSQDPLDTLRGYKSAVESTTDFDDLSFTRFLSKDANKRVHENRSKADFTKEPEAINPSGSPLDKSAAIAKRKELAVKFFKSLYAQYPIASAKKVSLTANAAVFTFDWTARETYHIGKNPQITETKSTDTVTLLCENGEWRLDKELVNITATLIETDSSGKVSTRPQWKFNGSLP